MSPFIAVTIDRRDGFAYAVADVLAAVCEEFGMAPDDDGISIAIADCVDRMKEAT